MWLLLVRTAGRFRCPFGVVALECLAAKMSLGERRGYHEIQEVSAMVKGAGQESGTKGASSADCR
jgi:hypothetical protein